MSENTENVEKNEKTLAVTTTDNVVLYPVSDSAGTTNENTAQNETTQNETTQNEITPAETAQNKTTPANESSSDTTDTMAQDSDSDTHATDHLTDHSDDTTDDNPEEDFYEQQEASRSKDEHPFREFFSNFRSKRKIEMNRDEQILSRISDDDLMEYLRMEQKRMELLQQAKEVREKRFWTTFQLLICLLSVVLIIYFLKDNPVILVTILYTLGILAALRIWSKTQNGRDNKDGKDSSGQHKKPWE